MTYGTLLQYQILTDTIYPLYTRTLGTGPLANSEDPDTMSHFGAFHQGLHCFLRQK